MKSVKYMCVVMSILLLSVFSGCSSVDSCVKVQKCESQYDVAAIVWPAYQPEPRWKDLGIFGDGKGEWQNVYEAKPKFKGHQQPLVPLWGYENEADPIVVARKIDAALAAGVNVFMYDWYWYENKPFLEGALNDGLLKAPNNERMKFFLMWANHDVDGLWNNKLERKAKKKVVWSADISYDEFVNVIVPRWIAYFKKPNYYKIDNKPVLAIFDLPNMIRGMDNSPEKTRKALDYLRAECKKAGFNGLHFMSMAWYGPARGAVPNIENPTPADVVKYYGFDSLSVYNMQGPYDDYNVWPQRAMKEWHKFMEAYSTFHPIASTGWDNNPRFLPKDITNVAKNKSPVTYEKVLRMVKKWADENIKTKRKLIIINAWNEWTEDGYLEPDTRFGYGYLNATARVFGAHGQKIEEK